FGWASLEREATRPTVQMQRLAAELDTERVLPIGGSSNDALLPGTWARVWQIPSAGGYAPMLLRRYNQLTTIGTSGSVRPAVLGECDAALDLAAVRYAWVRVADQASTGT